MKKHFRAIGDFWRVEYGRYVGMTAIAFLVLVVLAYIAGRLFPDIPVTVIGAFNEVVADSGIVQEDGSFDVLALFGNNLRAMVLSILYGFIPFLYLPALSMGVNAAIIGMLAAMIDGQWLLSVPVQKYQRVYPQKRKGHHEAAAAEHPACGGAAGRAAACAGRRGGDVCDPRSDAAFYVRIGPVPFRYTSI